MFFISRTEEAALWKLIEVSEGLYRIENKVSRDRLTVAAGSSEVARRTLCLLYQVTLSKPEQAVQNMGKAYVRVDG